MLSKTCKTAIKAVIYRTSKETTEERSGVKEIAKQINVVCTPVKDGLAYLIG